jgi:hypothetical protein
MVLIMIMIMIMTSHSLIHSLLLYVEEHGDKSKYTVDKAVDVNSLASYKYY